MTQLRMTMSKPDAETTELRLLNQTDKVLFTNIAKSHKPPTPYEVTMYAGDALTGEVFCTGEGNLFTFEAKKDRILNWLQADKTGFLKGMHSYHRTFTTADGRAFRWKDHPWKAGEDYNKLGLIPLPDIKSSKTPDRALAYFDGSTAETRSSEVGFPNGSTVGILVLPQEALDPSSEYPLLVDGIPTDLLITAWVMYNLISLNEGLSPVAAKSGSRLGVGAAGFASA